MQEAKFGKMEMSRILVLIVFCSSPARASAGGGDADAGGTSYMLLGGMAVIMSIFYLVNSHVRLIVDSTWAMINSAVSIFCAVLTFNIVNTILNLMLNLKEPNEDEPPTWGNILSASIQLVIWWYVVVFLLYFVKSSLLHLKGYGTVGGHILGFAAINLYGKLALTKAFRANPWWTVFDLGLAFLTMALLFFSSRFVHVCVKSRGSYSDADDDRWHEQSLDTGNDFFALCLGFLTSMLLRFMITGSLPSIDGELGGQSTGKVLELLAAAWLAVILSGLFAIALQIFEERHGKESIPAICVEFLASVFADTAAFSALFAAMWYLGGNISQELLAHTVIAHYFSVFAIVCMLIISKIVARSGSAFTWLRGAYTAIGLAMGLSWEKTFDASLDGLGDLDWFEGSEKQQDVRKVVMTAILLVVVFPAWMVYILPKSDEDLKKKLSKTLANGSLPCRALWSDSDLYDDTGSVDEDQGQGRPLLTST